MGSPVLKNWKPKEIISFLRGKGFEEIKKKKRKEVRATTPAFSTNQRKNTQKLIWGENHTRPERC